MMPKKATPFDAAYDVYVPEDTDLKIGRQRIDLKFRMELPHGMQLSYVQEAAIRSKVSRLLV